MSICQLRVTYLSINQYFVKTKQNLNLPTPHPPPPCTENRNLSFTELSSYNAGQKNSSFLPDGGDRKAHLHFSPITKGEAFNNLALNNHETP